MRWKEKNVEKRWKKERECRWSTAERERQKEDEKSNLCVRKRKRETYIEREGGRGEGMRGPVSVSLQFCGVVR